MILGSMKEVNLTRAKEIFLFDNRVAGWDAQALSMYFPKPPPKPQTPAKPTP